MLSSFILCVSVFLEMERRSSMLSSFILCVSVFLEMIFIYFAIIKLFDIIKPDYKKNNISRGRRFRRRITPGRAGRK